MKIAVLISSILVLIGLTAGHSKQAHDFIIGQRVYGDFLLDQAQIEKRSFPLKVIDKEVTIKGNGVARITRIEAIDLKANGHTAEVTIARGGPGETYVTLHFKSKRGHGLHFLVKVYGKD